MTDIDLDALEATARAATPGPWWQGREVRHESDLDVYSERDVSDTSHDIATHVWSTADAEHIAAFDPTTVLALIARLREAEDDRDKHVALAGHFAGRAMDAENVINRLDTALRADGRSAMLVVTAQEIITQYRETTETEGSEER